MVRHLAGMDHKEIAGERADWQKLWADVDVTLKKATETGKK
jgi:hypothetical protein